MIEIPLEKLPDLTELGAPRLGREAFRDGIEFIRSCPAEKALEKTAVAVGILDRVTSTLLQNGGTGTHASEIEGFLRANKDTLADALTVTSSVSHRLRYEANCTPDHDPRFMPNPELLAKAKLYAAALRGAEFIQVMDVNGTVSNLDGRFFTNTEEALERALSYGKVGFITGDSLESILDKFLIPTGVVSRKEGERYPLAIGKDAYRGLSTVTESGLRRLDFEAHSASYKETLLSEGLSTDTIALISERLKKEILSPEGIKQIKTMLYDAGCAWSSLEPGTIQEREAGGQIRSLTIALFGGLTGSSRELLRDPSIADSDSQRALLRQAIIFRERTQMKLLELFSDNPGLARRFQIGGLGSIDTVIANKGEIAYDQFITPLLRSERDAHRPIAAVTFGDRTQDRFGNDNPFRDISLLHGENETDIYTISFDCSGVQTSFPIDLSGQNTLYTICGASQGGTAHAIHMACDAASLSNFVFERNLA